VVLKMSGYAAVRPTATDVYSTALVLLSHIYLEGLASKDIRKGVVLYRTGEA
jgi:hypothetical protein